MKCYITPNFTTKWKEIGIGLGIPQEMINIIEKDSHMHSRCERQCNAMFSQWLEVEPNNATWKKLLTILVSPAINIIQANPTVNVIQTDHGQFICT